MIARGILININYAHRVEQQLLKKALQGDVRSCITWLKQKAPESWGASQVINNSYFSGTPIEDEINYLLENPSDDRNLEDYY